MSGPFIALLLVVAFTLSPLVFSPLDYWAHHRQDFSWKAWWRS